MPNIELLDKALARVQREAKRPGNGRWYQGSWDTGGQCGTVYCFAGWACYYSGQVSELGTIVTEGKYKGMATGIVAMELLGLTREEASAMFNGGASLRCLEKAARAIRRRAKAEEEVAE